MTEIKNTILRRMTTRLEPLYKTIALCLSYGNTGYYVAGNSCNAGVPNDYDLYPLAGESFDFTGIKDRVSSCGGYVICETKNALTVNFNGKVVQFCAYSKPGLNELIDSFDFAHIQIGVEVGIEWRPGDFEDDPGGYDTSKLIRVEYTGDWVQSHLLETTWYTGSEYPLSSLIRITKYFNRGCYAKKHEYKKDVLNILKDIISRGYNNYEDFKDQLAAVDLLLLEPEEKEAAWSLFCTCCNSGLVTNTNVDVEA